MKKLLLSAALAALCLPSIASAAITIDVNTWLAPNAFGSPNYNPAVQNAISGMHAGQSSYGDPNSPSHFKETSNVRADQVVVTGFTSWLGDADPTGAYANELGNRMHFGVRIDGGGQQFSASQISFAAVSTDTYLGNPYNGLGMIFGAGAFNYSLGYQGVLKGDDGALWTMDDVFVTNGANTQLVDGFLGRGPGNSFAAYCAGCTSAQEQQAIMDVASYPGHDFKFTGTYMLGGESGSGTFNISAVPEPATWAMMLVGFFGLGSALRANRRLVPLAA